MKIRLFTPSDVSQLAAIFEASVMQGSGEFYSFAERSAWAYIEGETRSESYWLERLQGTTIWVAETDNMLVGFINLKIGADSDVEAAAGEQHPREQGQGADRYGQGRHARHRQEPRQDDDRG